MAYVVLAALSPMSATYVMGLWWYGDQGLAAVLVELAKGWVAQGVWTEFVVWGIWWQAWVVGGTAVWSGVFLEEGGKAERWLSELDGRS